MEQLRAAARLVADALAVLVEALRLVARHAPVLLSLVLLGAAVHGGALWLGVLVSRVSPFAASFVLPLAPIGSLVAVILMLRAVSPSLRVAHTDDGSATDVPGDRPEGVRGLRVGARARIGLLASTLVPFLGLYVADGRLDADRAFYANQAVYDELFGAGSAVWSGGQAQTGRAVVATGGALLAVIAVTLLLRRLVNHFDLAGRNPLLGLTAAYLEVYWLFSVAKAWASTKDYVTDWVSGRAAVAWASGQWESLVAALGPVGRPVRAAVDWLLGLLADASDVVLVPLAWLAVGAVVFGRRLPDADRPGQPRSLAGAGRLGRLRSWWAILPLPTPVRRWLGQLGADQRDRFRDLREGLHLLARGGLAPMLGFCLLFALTHWLDWGVASVARALLGPRSAETGLAFSSIVGVLVDAVRTVVLVGLLAAAVDRVLSAPAAPAARHTPAAATTP